MKDQFIGALRDHLNVFEIPYTGRLLGNNGAQFEIDTDKNGYHVRVQLGFPVTHSRSTLTEALIAHYEILKSSESIEFSITWSVEAHSVQQGLKPLEGVSNLIAVASGKGGVGKSTVTANIGLALVAEGAQVGILDADIYGPSQPRMLGLMGKRPNTTDGKHLEPLVAYGIRTMSIGFLVDERQPMAWRGPMVTSALNQLLTQTLWSELDYLLVDMPPGTGDIQLTLSQQVPVSGALIVTTPQDIALADARKGLEMFQKVNVPVLGVIENMSTHACSNCGHEESIFGREGGDRLADEYGLPFLGTLPLDRRIREETDRGEPSVIADPNGSIASAYRAIALRAVGELAAGGKDYSRLFPKITVEEDS